MKHLGALAILGVLAFSTAMFIACADAADGYVAWCVGAMAFYFAFMFFHVVRISFARPAQAVTARVVRSHR